MLCEATALGICFNRPPSDAGFAIFGFAEFLGALALLVLVYNATDVRYRFRVSAAPIPLYRLTFVSTAIIGFGSLLTDLWFSERWLAPAANITRAEIQTFFGAVFLSVILLWTLFAFVAPSRFGKFNARRFAQTVHSFLMRGSREDLDAVSTEIGRSAPYIFKHAAKFRSLKENEKPDRTLLASMYAYDLLSLIAHKRLCRHIVINNPVTAIVIADEAFKTKIYSPLGQFFFRITDASLEERDSIVFHEGEYFTGLIGQMRSFLNSIYGRFQMIEDSGHSALDLDYKLVKKMEPDQLAMYSEMIVTTFKSYLSTQKILNHSYSLHRSIGNLRDACSPLSSLNKIEIFYENRIDRNLNIVVDTLKQLIDAIDSSDIKLIEVLSIKTHENHFMGSIIDSISRRLVDIMTDAGNISGPTWTAWSVQHNTIWSTIFSGESKRYSAWWFVQLRIRQKIYRELKHMERSPNYQHARILRFLLNVMKWSVGARQDYPTSEYQIRRIVIPWISKNFLTVLQSEPEVAKFCLTDDMIIDQENSRLGKRHEKNLWREETWTYLDLLPATISSTSPTSRKPAVRPSRRNTKPKTSPPKRTPLA
jgi:hypothetical protein